jgi:hypothetical protein
MRLSAIGAPFLLACTLSAQTTPNFKPGDTCQALRAAYGKESQLDGALHVWSDATMNLRVFVKPGGPCVAASVNYQIQPGHTFRTRDGIVLGKDTTADARLKLNGRIDNTSFYFLRGEGKAYAQLVVPPTPAFPFKSTYGWQLNSAAESRLKAPPVLSDFTSEPVTFYWIDTPDPQGMRP